jgi:hypothetical protein
MKLMQEEDDLKKKIVEESNKRGVPPPDFEDENFDFENPFAPRSNDPEGDTDKDMPTFDPKDKFPFESYLKSGDYLHIGKKRTAAEMMNNPEEF